MTGFLRTFPGMLPMQLGVEGELWVFLISCITGGILGLCYQVLRILRVVLPHFRWAVFTEDLLFGLFCGMCYFLLFSYYSLTMRWFIAFGMGAAAIIVHMTAGRLLLKAVRRTDRTLKELLAKTAKRIRRKFV